MLTITITPPNQAVPATASWCHADVDCNHTSVNLEMSNADEDTLRAMRAASPALQKWWSDGKVKYTNNGKAKLHVHRGSKQTV